VKIRAPSASSARHSLIKIRARYGDLRRAARIAGPGSTGTADILTWRFDVAYYSAILSFLGIHYSHDHFLFTDFEALAPARSR